MSLDLRIDTLQLFLRTPMDTGYKVKSFMSRNVAQIFCEKLQNTTKEDKI